MTEQLSPRIADLDRAALQARIGRLLGGSDAEVRLIADKPLKAGRVHRQLWRAGNQSQACIVKRFAPERSHVERLILQRWLPALGLADIAPGLLAVIGGADTRVLWHVYEDLGDGTLDADERPHGVRDRGFLSGMRSPPRGDRLEAALASLARLHQASADHALLGECRYWAGDRAGAFLAASVRDATRALEALRPIQPDHLRTLEGLLAALARLKHEEQDRCEQLAAAGGPECLLHGDFGVRNVILRPDGVGRLIDWDHAGVGPASYDLSTLLLQLPPAGRVEALERYRGHRNLADAEWPDLETWNGLFDTAERSRLANCVIWPALSALDGEGDSAFEALSAIAAWFEALQPVLLGAVTPGERA